jgi:hypothetical protein
VKPRHFLSAVAMLVALAAGWFAEPAHSFEKRWPVAMAPAISWEAFQTARAVAARPSFCQWNYYGSACRLSSVVRAGRHVA